MTINQLHSSIEVIKRATNITNKAEVLAHLEQQLADLKATKPAIKKQWLGIYEEGQYQIVGTEMVNSFGDLRTNEIAILKDGVKIFGTGNNCSFTNETLGMLADKIIHILNYNESDVPFSTVIEMLELLLTDCQYIRFDMWVKRIDNRIAKEQQEQKFQATKIQAPKLKVQAIETAKENNKRILFISYYEAIIMNNFKDSDKLTDEFLKSEYKKHQFTHPAFKNVIFKLIQVSPYGIENGCGYTIDNEVELYNAIIGNILIHNARQSLHKSIDTHGLNSQITICASQELDKLLNKYGHIIKE